jgi:hypothetical protein
MSKVEAQQALETLNAKLTAVETLLKDKKCEFGKVRDVPAYRRESAKAELLTLEQQVSRVRDLYERLKENLDRYADFETSLIAPKAPRLPPARKGEKPQDVARAGVAKDFDALAKDTENLASRVTRLAEDIPKRIAAITARLNLSASE